MLYAAMFFFALGLVAVLMGATDIGGVSMEMGQTLLGMFLILAVVSLMVSLFRSKKQRLYPRR
ncbi:MAG TPA: DUF1328 domain-containing protein [Bdellovibrionales bacterium]|nr:DUF1328 domain-containing protein [Bdellovibrionales bacterium]